NQFRNNDLTDRDISHVAPANDATAALLAEYRVWDRCRTADEIRADFDRSFEGEPLPTGLVTYFAGGGSWGKLHGSARVTRTLDPPPVLTAAEAHVQSEKLAKYRALANSSGDLSQGKPLAPTCPTCHTIA